ncbi:hypothetical protein [Paenibacillus wynnii]|uniref:hypothetical protein n=1 Tax=Paenibacillus wynnii TaxID=268407 RepID=UPI0027947A33|nr:hypothetical protein [Paenibacillus wynnii]MDQ0195354.1 hypothetical protein [Paenibacillus wynnii]
MNSHELEYLFDVILDKSVFEGREIVNEFDELDRIISYYKNKIDTADNNQAYLSLGHELFEKRIDFTYCKGGYSIVWDINRSQATINYLFQQGNREIYELTAEELLPFTRKTILKEVIYHMPTITTYL